MTAVVLIVMLKVKVIMVLEVLTVTGVGQSSGDGCAGGDADRHSGRSDGGGVSSIDGGARDGDDGSSGCVMVVAKVWMVLMMEGVVVTVVIVANYCGGDVGDGDNSGVEDAGGGNGGCGYTGYHGVGGCSDRDCSIKKRW